MKHSIVYFTSIYELQTSGKHSNNTSTFIEEIQRYECLYNKLSKDYKNRRTRENAWETIGQKFGVTAEAVPKTNAFLDVLSSSSSQNITENQITSQKSSSIDCRHFNFDIGGKKIPIATLFYRLIRYKRFNGNQGIARIASNASVFFFFTSGGSFQATETILATATTIWKPGNHYAMLQI